MRTPLPSLLFHILCLLLATWANHAQATQWINLKKTSQSTLMIDKQSITEQAPHIKAWVKVEYRTPQKNVESVDRMYNNARALWYFDCTARKAATVQVFQYEDQELVYSAGIDPKQADFVEPLPESEVEITQQYVCQRQASEKRRAEAKAAKEAAAPASAKPAKTPAGTTDAEAGQNAAAKPAEDKSVDTKSASKKDGITPPAEAAASTAKDIKAAKETKPAPEKNTDHKDTQDKSATEPSAKHKLANEKPGKENSKSSKAEDKDWRYSGDHGPDKWGSLSNEFQLCSTGVQQSPVILDNTIPAALKPLKRLQKFPLKSIAYKEHSLQIDAGTGNMMVLDQKPYQLKYLILHLPSEHQIKEKSFAAELQMLHEDKNGRKVMIAVLFEEGSANPVMEKLLGSLPKEGESSKAIAMRITPADLMPVKQAYYRYSGSLTTPPCSEGVQWIIMKEPLKLSKAQIEALQSALGGPNHRPVQDPQGRMILE